MAPSAAPKKTFFALPGELRDIVYELTFTRTVDLVLSTHHTAHSNGSLLLTTRQVHNETAKLYYERTAFYATHPERLYSWITALPRKYLQAIRTIRCTWSAFWILEMLWQREESCGLALMLSDKGVLKGWKCVGGECHWETVYGWVPALTSFESLIHAIP